MTVYFISIPNVAIDSAKDYTTLTEKDTMEFLNPILDSLGLPKDKFSFYGNQSYDFQMVQVHSELKNEVRLFAEKLEPTIREKTNRADPEVYLNIVSSDEGPLVQIEFAESLDAWEEGEAEVLDWQ